VAPTTFFFDPVFPLSKRLSFSLAFDLVCFLPTWRSCFVRSLKKRSPVRRFPVLDDPFSPSCAFPPCFPLLALSFFHGFLYFFSFTLRFFVFSCRGLIWSESRYEFHPLRPFLKHLSSFPFLLPWFFDSPTVSRRHMWFLFRSALLAPTRPLPLDFCPPQFFSSRLPKIPFRFISLLPLSAHFGRLIFYFSSPQSPGIGKPAKY